MFKTKTFARFARREKLSDQALWQAILAAEKRPDADLGGGLIKQRVARAGGGKSGGYRTIIAWRRGDVAFFLFGYSKSGRSNVSTAEEHALHVVGATLLSAANEHVALMIETGELVEVRFDDERET
ncbi:MAG TPA: type II toxin-antitoxin system RelE/ParE family toxin [Thermomicrobiales bacterium]|nr:type II toxin-antitoxin system RelE/ParE family toxin [Thermomicrobiales bacterium]